MAVCVSIRLFKKFMTSSFFKQSIFFAFFCITISGYGQSLTLPNEEPIFSFTTKNGKKVTLNKDKANKYIIYRLGNKNKIEYEFPGNLKTSWKDFYYTFSLREPGPSNEGKDLSYIYFYNKDFLYVIYDEYFYTGNKHEIGLKIINRKSNQKTIIKGDIKTLKGTLANFRENNLLEITDDLDLVY